MTDHLPAVRRLRDENGWGSVKIGRELGIGRDAALRLMRKLELKDARKAAQVPAIISASGLPALSFYDTARQALAQAKTLSEVKDIADKSAAMSEYARRAHDKELMVDALDIRERAKAEWGRLALAAGLNKGTRGSLRGDVPVGGRSPEPPTDPRQTLKEMGIDKKFSVDAQKLAKLSDRAIEARLAERRRAIADGDHRVTMNILKPMPSRSMNRVEAAESLDPFFTPPWATRALCEIVLPHLGIVWDDTPWHTWEPACGEGHMAEVLKEYFGHVTATDIHDYGYAGLGRSDYDFLHRAPDPPPEACDWIITNPPFRGDTAERFVLRALDLAGTGVAIFVALQFLETVGRYNRIFKDRPPTLISFFSERVNCCKGRWDPDGSTDAAYIWLVWMKDRAPMAPFWIPPGQREALAKPDDRARFAAWSMPHDPETGEVTEAAE
jgi:hypothetical protein